MNSRLFARYERISSELQSDLLTRFKAGYGDESSADFQRLWDKVQVKSRYSF